MKKVALITALLVGIFTFLPRAQATVITFDLDYEFSEAYEPAGPTPWLTATFDDGGKAGSVTLTMAAVGLTGDEFVTAWYFNFDPSLVIKELIVTPGGGQSKGTYFIYQGSDSQKAAGDILFDIEFSLPTSYGDRFEANSGDWVWSLEYPGITAAAFDFFSTSKGDKGPFKSAAHVQGIALKYGSTDGSGWIAPSDSVSVPEPSTMLMLGVGLIGLAGIGRKKFVKK